MFIVYFKNIGREYSMAKVEKLLWQQVKFLREKCLIKVRDTMTREKVVTKNKTITSKEDNGRRKTKYSESEYWEWWRKGTKEECMI